MTGDARAIALQALGYTPRQAAFLALVAVHGGYFLRRQFAAFLGQPDGGLVTGLGRRVVQWGHAVCQRVARDTHIFHLSWRPLYGVIGEPDSRFRRPALPATIAVRLMTVDVVLGWRDRMVLATEAEKLRYFAEEWAIPRECLPAMTYRSAGRDRATTTRYFVDHAPIAIAPNSSELTVAYVQGWTHGIGGFRTFLSHYQPLLDRLPAVQVLYVTTRPDLVRLAEQVFVSVWGEKPTVDRNRPTPEQLAAHFRVRQQLEQHGPWGLSPQTLAQYAADQPRLGTSTWQPLFARWCVAGDIVLEGLRRPVAPIRVGTAPRFASQIVRRWYPVFPPIEARHDTHRQAA